MLWILVYSSPFKFPTSFMSQRFFLLSSTIQRFVVKPSIFSLMSCCTWIVVLIMMLIMKVIFHFHSLLSFIVHLSVMLMSSGLFMVSESFSSYHFQRVVWSRLKSYYGMQFLNLEIVTRGRRIVNKNLHPKSLCGAKYIPNGTCTNFETIII